MTKTSQASDQNPSKTPIPVEIKADKIDFPRRRVVHLRGYTQLIRGGHRVYADELTFDKDRQEIVARGLVTFETPKGDLIKTSVLRYEVDRNHMESGPAEFVLANRGAETIGATGTFVTAHGTADHVVFQGVDIMQLKGVKLMTCLDGRDDFAFVADELKIDMSKGLRLAKRAKLRLLTPDRHSQIKGMLN